MRSAFHCDGVLLSHRQYSEKSQQRLVLLTGSSLLLYLKDLKACWMFNAASLIWVAIYMVKNKLTVWFYFMFFIHFIIFSVKGLYKIKLLMVLFLQKLQQTWLHIITLQEDFVISVLIMGLFWIKVKLNLI